MWFFYLFFSSHSIHICSKFSKHVLIYVWCFVLSFKFYSVPQWFILFFMFHSILSRLSLFCMSHSNLYGTVYPFIFQESFCMSFQVKHVSKFTRIVRKGWDLGRNDCFQPYDVCNWILVVILWSFFSWDLGNIHFTLTSSPFIPSPPAQDLRRAF